MRRHVKAVLGTGEGKRPVAFVTQWSDELGPLDKRVVRVGDLTDTHDFGQPTGAEADSQQYNTHFLSGKGGRFMTIRPFA